MIPTDLTMVIDPSPTQTRVLLTEGSEEVLKARLGAASRTHRAGGADAAGGHRAVVPTERWCGLIV